MAHAGLVIAVGTCAAYGGLPKASPNPSDAISVGDLMDQGRVANKPLINLPGCPPVPEVMTGTIAHYLAYGKPPELDELVPMVEKATQAYKVCKSRIEAVEKSLEKHKTQMEEQED